jgi:hypothetical protein
VDSRTKRSAAEPRSEVLEWMAASAVEGILDVLDAKIREAREKGTFVPTGRDRRGLLVVALVGQCIQHLSPRRKPIDAVGMTRLACRAVVRFDAPDLADAEVYERAERVAQDYATWTREVSDPARQDDATLERRASVEYVWRKFWPTAADPRWALARAAWGAGLEREDAEPRNLGKLFLELVLVANWGPEHRFIGHDGRVHVGHKQTRELLLRHGLGPRRRRRDRKAEQIVEFVEDIDGAVAWGRAQRLNGGALASDPGSGVPGFHEKLEQIEARRLAILETSKPASARRAVLEHLYELMGGTLSQRCLAESVGLEHRAIGRAFEKVRRDLGI